MIAPLAVRWLLTAVFAAAALGAALPRRSAVVARPADQAAMSAGMAAMLLAML